MGAAPAAAPAAAATAATATAAHPSSDAASSAAAPGAPHAEQALGLDVEADQVYAALEPSLCVVERVTVDGAGR